MYTHDFVTYISTYGRKCTLAGYGTPIEVGAAERSNYIYQTMDNTGDNISSENEFYGDLTALYWIWKNGIDLQNKYVSFRHYNKLLIIGKQKAARFLRNNSNGWIVAKGSYNPPHNYIHEWEIFRDLIKDKYPFYYNTLIETYDIRDGSGSKCNSTNMFITSVEQFEKYCSVLFDICGDLRSIIGNTEHSRYDQRYCAFMAERFLTVFINAHGFPTLEVSVYRKKWYIREIIKIANCVGINKENRLIQRVSNKLIKYSNNSSYLE